MRNFLVVNPETEFFETVRNIVRRAVPGVNVCAAAHGDACMRALDSAKLDLIILPQRSTADDTWAVLRSIRQSGVGIPILVVLPPENEALAPEALHNGATDVVIRTSFFSSTLPLAIRRCIESTALQSRLSESRREVDECKAAHQTMNAFLSTITHDLRTPLVGLRIYTQFLASGRLGPLAPIQKEKIEAIFRNAERLTHCIESIQRYQRLDSPTLELMPVDFDLRAVLSEAIAGIMPACMEKGISLGQSWPTEPVTVQADRELIIEVVKDLLDNAVSFTGTKGSITISVATPAFRQVQVSITDSGCGIAPERIPLLFEPRWTKSTSQGHGLGLGLRMVKRILDAHKSAIEVDSAVGSGTRVRFTLSTASQAPAVLFAPACDNRRELRKRVVLLVDDDEDNLACMRSVLEYAGYEVLGASGFDEAKVQLDEGHVDAVLLDIALRDADGLETLHNIKRCAATSNLPVVMVSANSDDDIRCKAVRLGAAGFVVKPFVPAKLLRELGTVMSARAPV